MTTAGKSMSETLERPADVVAAAAEAAGGLVQPGERMGFLYGVTLDQQFYSPDAQAGRPAVLLTGHRIPSQAMRPLVVAFARAAAAFAARGADLVIAGSEILVRTLAADVPRGAPVRLVDTGSCLASLGLVRAGQAAVVVIDRANRMVARFDTGDGSDWVAACLNCVAALPVEAPMDVALPAPVLMLPGLLPRALCRRLIARFEQGAVMEGAIASMGVDGTPCRKIDHHKKRRLDVVLAPEEDLQQSVRELLLQRCAPEIARAFQCRIAHTDRIVIARYDAAAGWFRRHRDNAGANVAFREFAISVNLNAEDHEGGHLWFPEFNDHRYSPPTGGALIFSTALLHEATEVQRGSRYVLLTFFHGAAAEERRLAYEARCMAQARELAVVN